MHADARFIGLQVAFLAILWLIQFKSQPMIDQGLMQKVMPAYTWEQIGDSWYRCDGIGAIRKEVDGKWWFFASWLPDRHDQNIGPFRTLKAAKAEAQRLFQGASP